jgi:hypothetical protein
VSKETGVACPLSTIALKCVQFRNLQSEESNPTESGHDIERKYNLGQPHEPALLTIGLASEAALHGRRPNLSLFTFHRSSAPPAA